MSKDFSFGDEDSVEKISAPGVFEDFITGWIIEVKAGSLSVNDVLSITTKVAEQRGTPGLVDEIRSRLGPS